MKEQIKKEMEFEVIESSSIEEESDATSTTNREKDRDEIVRKMIDINGVNSFYVKGYQASKNNKESIKTYTKRVVNYILYNFIQQNIQCKISLMSDNKSQDEDYLSKARLYIFMDDTKKWTLLKEKSLFTILRRAKNKDIIVGKMFEVISSNDWIKELIEALVRISNLRDIEDDENNFNNKENISGIELNLRAIEEKLGSTTYMEMLLDDFEKYLGHNNEVKKFMSSMNFTFNISDENIAKFNQDALSIHQILPKQMSGILDSTSSINKEGSDDEAKEEIETLKAMKEELIKDAVDNNEAYKINNGEIKEFNNIHSIYQTIREGLSELYVNGTFINSIDDNRTYFSLFNNQEAALKITKFTKKFFSLILEGIDDYHKTSALKKMQEVNDMLQEQVKNIESLINKLDRVNFSMMDIAIASYGLNQFSYLKELIQLDEVQVAVKVKASPESEKGWMFESTKYFGVRSKYGFELYNKEKDNVSRLALSNQVSHFLNWGEAFDEVLDKIYLIRNNNALQAKWINQLHDMKSEIWTKNSFLLRIKELFGEEDALRAAYSFSVFTTDSLKNGITHFISVVGDSGTGKSMFVYSILDFFGGAIKVINKEVMDDETYNDNLLEEEAGVWGTLDNLNELANINARVPLGTRTMTIVDDNSKATLLEDAKSQLKSLASGGRTTYKLLYKDSFATSFTSTFCVISNYEIGWGLGNAAENRRLSAFKAIGAKHKDELTRKEIYQKVNNFFYYEGMLEVMLIISSALKNTQRIPLRVVEDNKEVIKEVNVRKFFINLLEKGQKWNLHENKTIMNEFVEFFSDLINNVLIESDDVAKWVINKEERNNDIMLRIGVEQVDKLINKGNSFKKSGNNPIDTIIVLEVNKESKAVEVKEIKFTNNQEFPNFIKDGKASDRDALTTSLKKIIKDEKDYEKANSIPKHRQHINKAMDFMLSRSNGDIIIKNIVEDASFKSQKKNDAKKTWISFGAKNIEFINKKLNEDGSNILKMDEEVLDDEKGRGIIEEVITNEVKSNSNPSSINKEDDNIIDFEAINNEINQEIEEQLKDNFNESSSDNNSNSIESDLEANYISVDSEEDNQLIEETNELFDAIIDGSINEEEIEEE